MFFIKKLLLGLAAVVLIYICGSGTQSSNLLFQGGGFIGIIVGFVVLYLFGKMVWRAMGCIPVLLVICLIVGFVLYAIGAFNGGVGNVVPNVMNFLGISHSSVAGGSTVPAASATVEEKTTPPAAETPAAGTPSPAAPLLSENFDDIGSAAEELASPTAAPATAEAPAVRQPQPIAEESGLSKLLSSLTGGGSAAPAAAEPFNPNNYPAVYGVTRVINGDTLEMRGRYIKIYGIDAPESNQTCSDSRGRAYRCGQEAARWLKSWISGHELECHVIKQDSKGNMVATCALGQYDIGAALVNAGWAVADPSQNDIYMPYEQQARDNGRGLWQGQFYKPWDWREIQSKKPKIKIISPKKERKSILDF